MPNPNSDSIDPASFRDPSGFIFEENGVVYRQINAAYRENFEFLLDSALYESLTKSNLLVSHERVEPEAAKDLSRTEDAWSIIKPEMVAFISYPYEWSFGQLKAAALATLEIQKKSMEAGMSLKDASAYNIQFMAGKPVLIDTLSFEKYSEGQPWVAYRQFCQHFLAPLMLMHYTDIRLGQLLRLYIDGIPLDLAARLLPFRTRFFFSVLTHIRLHAKSQTAFADREIKTVSRKMSKHSLLALIDNLEGAVKGLKWKSGPTVWGGYYQDNNYSSKALAHKKQLVGEYLQLAKPTSVWDLGANTGLFSRIAASLGVPVVAFDIDPLAVELNYQECQKEQETRILPLLLDLTNPSPGLGWENRERSSLLDRGPVDCIMALALVHHLAIANNLPLSKVAEFFSRQCSWLIVEFVPKSDSQTKRLLASREDIFDQYNREGFEQAFSLLFKIIKSEPVSDSQRFLYLMQRK